MHTLQYQNIQQLASVAGEYCQLIEHLDQVEGDLLGEVSCLLPRLHAAVAPLERGSNTACGDEKGDLESRFELFIRLRRILGELDTYAMDYDASLGDGQMSGSLADDLTDIYFELKRGLRMLEKGQNRLERAADIWCGSYLVHWGQHLVDAERHLYELQVSRSLYPGNLHH